MKDIQNTHDTFGQRDKLPAYSRLWSQMLAFQKTRGD
jgi:hypothetical protein